MQINVVNVNKNVTIPEGHQGNVTVETNVVAANVNNIVPQDIVELSGQTQASNNRFNPDLARMREIWQDHDRHVESFRRLIEGLLNRQAERSNAAGIQWNRNDPNAMVEIDDETRNAAQEAIGEGGPFSVEAVATRLLDFAVAISGGDPARIEVLQRAVERGFEAAERQWGGSLPEISQQTREAVVNGFEQWRASGNAADIELLANRNGTQQAVHLPGTV